MEMMMCVVVAPSPDARNCIGSLLQARGMEVTLLASLEELPAILKTIPVCGILLEAMPSISSPRKGTESIHELVDLYPFATFRLAGKKVLVLGKAESLEEFVEQCRRFTPRVVRREARTIMHLAIHLSADNTFKDAEQTVTINVSNIGCFVYSIRKWTIGNRVWLRLLGDDLAISGTVCSWQPWGNNKLLPGIGIELDEEFISGWAGELESNGLGADDMR